MVVELVHNFVDHAIMKQIETAMKYYIQNMHSSKNPGYKNALSVRVLVISSAERIIAGVIAKLYVLSKFKIEQETKIIAKTFCFI